MESSVAYEVFSGRQLIWEQWCVRQREENENVTQYTREPAMADGGQIVQKTGAVCLWWTLVITASVTDTLKVSPVIWNADKVLKITNQKKNNNSFAS